MVELGIPLNPYLCVVNSPKLHFFAVDSESWRTNKFVKNFKEKQSNASEWKFYEVCSINHLNMKSLPPIKKLIFKYRTAIKGIFRVILPVYQFPDL